VRLAEAPSFGQPILLYDVQSVGARSYLAVGQELIRRIEQPESLESAEAVTQELPAAVIEGRPGSPAVRAEDMEEPAATADIDAFPPDDAPLDDLMADEAGSEGDAAVLDDALDAEHDPVPADTMLTEVRAEDILGPGRTDETTVDAPTSDTDRIDDDAHEHTESAEVKP
jgi:hypothetical protein